MNTMKLYGLLATQLALRFALVTGEHNLVTAARDGRCPIVKYYLSEGEDPNASLDGYPAILYAALGGHVDCVIALRNHGATKLPRDSLTKEFDETESESVRMALILAGVNPVDGFGSGWTALGYSAFVGCLACVRGLLSEGSETETPISRMSTETPLMAASDRGHYEVVLALLGRNANVTAKDSSSGEIALHKAAAKGYLKIARVLVGMDPFSINERDNEGKTPLHRAAENDHPAIVHLLLQRGADALGPSKDNEGKTALDLANSDEVRRLLSE